jgi:hypothetical protein
MYPLAIATGFEEPQMLRYTQPSQSHCQVHNLPYGMSVHHEINSQNRWHSTLKSGQHYIRDYEAQYRVNDAIDNRACQDQWTSSTASPSQPWTWSSATPRFGGQLPEFSSSHISENHTNSVPNQPSYLKHFSQRSSDFEPTPLARSNSMETQLQKNLDPNLFERCESQNNEPESRMASHSTGLTACKVDQPVPRMPAEAFHLDDGKDEHNDGICSVGNDAEHTKYSNKTKPAGRKRELLGFNNYRSPKKPRLAPSIANVAPPFEICGENHVIAKTDVTEDPLTVLPLNGEYALVDSQGNDVFSTTAIGFSERLQEVSEGISDRVAELKTSADITAFLKSMKDLLGRKLQPGDPYLIQLLQWDMFSKRIIADDAWALFGGMFESRERCG